MAKVVCEKKDFYPYTITVESKEEHESLRYLVSNRGDLATQLSFGSTYGYGHRAYQDITTSKARILYNLCLQATQRSGVR